MTEGFGNFSNLIGFEVISFTVRACIGLRLGVRPKVHALGHARRFGVKFHKLSNKEEIVSQSLNGVIKLDATRIFNVECHIV